ncbi:flagellar motor switch protein FliN [Pelagibacterium lentulum]|uniref:Flagellar motor switch protein FliN n=2 Tax=Pelagibacterium lentulum TaxID=2029865 RepID=A0A916W0Z1_9HYPH|nr:flagellar motor switch protein FliN [Pelagibacterium lentulum]
MADSDDDIATSSDNVTFEEMLADTENEDMASGERSADDLEAVFDVPVRLSVVLGRTKMPVSNLLKMDVGSVVELDRQVGEAVDIYVNDRIVARGEIVLVDGRLGVTMTEIIKAG